MKFQDKAIESARELRERALQLTGAALEIARARTGANAGRIEQIKTSLNALGAELKQLTRRHMSRFVKQNSRLARVAGTEVSALLRSTYDRFSNRAATAPRSRAAATTRKRAAKATRSRSPRKAA
jgi:hypothetical protein